MDFRTHPKYSSTGFVNCCHLFSAESKEGSIEDLTVSPAERQTKIKARLKKFFNRRPTMEALVKKGIWKGKFPAILLNASCKSFGINVENVFR